MTWVHTAPSVHVLTARGVPFRVHVSLLFLSALVATTGWTNLGYTGLTLVLGWLAALVTSLCNYLATVAVGGKIAANLLCAPGWTGPCSYRGVSAPLKLLAAVAGPMPYCVSFVLTCVLSGGRVESALGLIAPNDRLTTFEAVVAWSSSFTLWQIAINFIYPLHPLTGFELLRHSLGRLVSRQTLVTAALAVAVPMTALFIWQGGKYMCLLQIWIGIWGLPQLFQVSLALASGSVDRLPFFAT